MNARNAAKTGAKNKKNSNSFFGSSKTASKKGPGKKNPEKEISTQESIPYKAMYRDGICHGNDGRFSKTVKFYDINYQLAQAEDKASIFENWCDFLNYLLLPELVHSSLSKIKDPAIILTMKMKQSMVILKRKKSMKILMMISRSWK